MATDMTQTTELTQAMQTLKWLDEERRKDRATIAALQERAQGQEQQLAQQATQIQALQTALASIQGLISQAADFGQTVSNYKTELNLQMDQREEAWRKEQAEADRLRRVEYETLTTNLNRLEKQMRVLPHYDEELNARRAENQRLGEVLQRLDVTVGDLSKRSDDRVQAVTYLEEQRRTDNRRVADLERDNTELYKRTEALTTKSSLLEDTLQKQEARIREAIQETKKYEKPIEELRVSDFQREQKMKQYLDQGEQVAHALERVRAQTQAFVEYQQRVNRALEKLESFQARIEKRQNEVAQMQRLAEDRLKREWEEWQDERDKELKKRQLTVDEQWRSQEQKNQGHSKSLERLEGRANGQQAYIEALLETQRADAQHTLKSARETLERAEQMLAEGLSTMRGEQ
jgi:chromosome segregation ATPase